MRHCGCTEYAPEANHCVSSTVRRRDIVYESVPHAESDEVGDWWRFGGHEVALRMGIL